MKLVKQNGVDSWYGCSKVIISPRKIYQSLVKTFSHPVILLATCNSYFCKPVVAFFDVSFRKLQGAMELW